MQARFWQRLEIQPTPSPVMGVFTLPAWPTNVFQLNQSLLSRRNSAVQAGGVPVGSPSLHQNSSCGAAASLRSTDRQCSGDDSPPMSRRAGRTVCRDLWEQSTVEPRGPLRNLLPI